MYVCTFAIDRHVKSASIVTKQNTEMWALEKVLNQLHIKIENYNVYENLISEITMFVPFSAQRI